MKCEEFRNLLDDYVDGALTEEQIVELEKHAQECDECSKELRSAMLLKNMFADMADTTELPEEARYLLYERVRNEKRKSKRGMYIRIFSAAAAVLVLFFGVSSLFNNKDAGNELSEIAQIAEYDFVASDGEAQDTETDRSAGKTVVKLKSGDSEAAKSAVETLASQYDGSASVSADDATVTVDIPAESVDEFIEDISAAGEAETVSVAETDDETVEIEIVIEEE